MEIKQFITQVKTALENVDEKILSRIIDILFDTYVKNKRVFIIGNGGSADNANHFSEDLCKGTSENFSIPGVKAVSLSSHISFITALANDEGYDSVFERQLTVLAQGGDVLIAISCSGNSPNIIRAVEYARNNNVTVIGITAFYGGKLKSLSEVCLLTPVKDFGFAESLHLLLFHHIVDELRHKIKKSHLNKHRI